MSYCFGPGCTDPSHLTEQQLTMLDVKAVLDVYREPKPLRIQRLEALMANAVEDLTR